MIVYLKRFIFLISVLGIFALLYGSTWSTNEDIKEIQYLLIDKITNINNRDTVSRKVPFVINFKVFLEYPLLGVGNGNQGFFYLKYFPEWAYSSYDAQELLYNATQRVSNGALFFPGILSGYGMLGTAIAFLYGIKSTFLAIKEKSNLEMFYYMYIISAAAIFITGFSSEFVGNYSIWFCLSIPYVYGLSKDSKGELEVCSSCKNSLKMGELTKIMPTPDKKK